MVSIIVPVYTGEAPLDRCVKSILAQTYTDIELILVDDGSTDGTAVLCDAWAEQDGRVRVIHQKNAGVSAARNAGLDIVSGDMIGFVDADDYIDGATYETAVTAMGDCDMIMWDAVTVWDDGRTEEDTIPLLTGSRILKKADWTPELLRWMAGAVWRCLYRAEMLKDIRFPVGIPYSEDRLFNLQAMGKARTLQYLKKGLYFRYMRQGSACNRYHGDLLEKHIKVYEQAVQYLQTYWTREYMPVYARAFVIDSALNDVYEICSREYPGKGRLKAIREVAEHPQLKEIFALCPSRNIQEKLLHKQRTVGLLLLGLLYRMKHH